MRFYHLLLTAFICLFSFSLAQSQSMVKEGNQWSLFSPAQFTPEESTTLIRVSGDTLINNETYSTFISTNDTLGDAWQALNVFMRQDTTGKVFIKVSNGEEKLVLDFGLEVGDFFDIESYSNECNLQVMEVDTVTLNNGERRKRLQLEEEVNNFRYTWIEGIGSAFGPFFRDYCLLDINTILICFSEQDELLYPDNPEFCFRATTSVSNTLPSDISIYPNPISDLLYVKHGSTQLQSISIINLYGVMVYQSPYTESLDVSQLANGTYTVLLEDTKGNVYSDKIVKMK